MSQSLRGTASLRGHRYKPGAAAPGELTKMASASSRPNSTSTNSRDWIETLCKGNGFCAPTSCAASCAVSRNPPFAISAMSAISGIALGDGIFVNAGAISVRNSSIEIGAGWLGSGNTVGSSVTVIVCANTTLPTEAVNRANTVLSPIKACLRSVRKESWAGRIEDKRREL
jgi:hypothetical protein